MENPMTVKRLLTSATISLSMTAILDPGNAWAASRLGNATDDSVCDVGRTDFRTRTSLENALIKT